MEDSPKGIGESGITEPSDELASPIVQISGPEVKEYRKIRHRNWPTLLQVFIAFLMLVVAGLSTYTAYQSKELTRENRMATIRPVLRLAAETGFDKDMNYVLICVQNVGHGPASNTWAFIQRDTLILTIVRNTFNVFYPTESRRRPGTVIRDTVLNEESRELREDFIADGAYAFFGVPCQDLFPDVKWAQLSLRQREDYLLPMGLKVHLSYHDLDGNEHLSVIATHPAASSGPMTVILRQNPNYEKLMRIGASVEGFNIKTFRDVGLRDSAGWTLDSEEP